MALDLATLLGDSTRFPDTLEFDVQGEKVSLGLVRAEAQRQQAALAAQQAAAKAELDNAKALATQAADLVTKLNTQREPVAAAAPVGAARSEAIDYETDPFLGPFYKQITGKLSPLEQQLKTAMDTIAQQDATLKNAAAIFSLDRWEREYERGRKRLEGDKYKDYRGPDGARKLAQYAAEHNLIDDFKLPSVTRAIDDITREDDLARQLREAREEGKREGITQGRMATMARPTSAAGGKTGAPKKGLEPGANFEDLGDAVAEDADLMGMLAQIGVNAPGDVQ